MADIPYSGWFNYIRKFLKSQNPVLELFSGPAQIARLARAEGYTVFALDNHLPFLKNKGGFQLVADAKNLPFRKAALGTLIASNCGLNYLADRRELETHLRDCRRVLIENGFYVFDVCPPERASQLHTTIQKTLEGKVSFAHIYQSASHILETIVTVTEVKRIRELHRQYIFSEDVIIEAAEAAGFTIARRAQNYALPVTGNLHPIETWVLLADNGEAG